MNASPTALTNVKTANTERCRDNRPYRCPTRRIIAHNKFLDRDGCLQADLTKERSAHNTRRIPLVRIGFYDDAHVQLCAVFFLMLLSIVGVDSMSTISRNQKTPGKDRWVHLHPNT